MANLFGKPVYEDDEKNAPQVVTAADRADPTLQGLTDEQILAAKKPATNNLFEQPVFEEEPPAEEPPPPEEGFWSKAGSLAMEIPKGMGGATMRTAGAVNTIGAGIPVLLDKLTSVIGGFESTRLQDAWFRNFVDPAFDQDRTESYAPSTTGSKSGDFAHKAVNAVGGMLSTISQLVLTGGEAAPAAAANVSTKQAVLQATEHGVKAMTVPAVSEAVNTGREVFQKTGDAKTAVAAAQTKYLTTAISGVLPLSAEGGLATRVATGALSGTVLGEAERNAMNTVLPADQQTPFSGEDTAINAITSGLMSGVMGPRAAQRREQGSPLSAIEEAQRQAAEEAKAKGGDQLDQVLAAAQAGAHASEEHAGAFYEHSNQIERLRMADEAAANQKAEADALAAEQAKIQQEMAEAAEKQAAVSDDQSAARAPRTPDEVVYQPPTGRKLAYEQGFDQAEAERAAKAPQEAAAKAKDYDEALVQREQQAAGQPVPAPKEPLATLGDVAPRNLFEKPVHEEPAPEMKTLREVRRLRQLEAQKAAPPPEPKLLEGPKPTGRFLVGKDGATRAELASDLRARNPEQSNNLTLRREAIQRERATVKEIDRAAREAQPAEENSRPAPTEAQDRAGNFKMGHTSLHGMDVTIEYPRGSKRPYTTREGVKGEREMPDHYGYFKGTKGADDMHVDVLIGKHPESENSYVVDHLDVDGNFEQHKVLSGYRNQLDAVRAYKKAYPERKVGPITEMSKEGLKDWLQHGNTTKPLKPNELGRAADRTEKTQARGSKIRYREGDIRTEQTDARQTNVTLEGKRGDVAGEVVLKHRGDAMQVINANVDDGMRGAGHGVRMYEEAVKKAHSEGKRLVSDTSVSENAARVYEALKRRGHDVHRNPNVETEDSPRYGKVLRSTDSRPVFEVHPKNAEVVKPSGLMQRRMDKMGAEIDRLMKQPHSAERNAAVKKLLKERQTLGDSLRDQKFEENFPSKVRYAEGGGIKLAPSLREDLLATEADTIDEHSPPLKSELAKQLRAGGKISGDALKYLKSQLDYHIDRLEDMVENIGPEHRNALRAAIKLKKQLDAAAAAAAEKPAESPKPLKREGADVGKQPAPGSYESKAHRESVRNAIEPLNKEMPGMKAEVHDNVASAPEHIRAQMEADGQTNARGVYDPETDTVHIFADNHASAEDAVRTAVHEGVAHKGLRHLLKEDFEPTMLDVFKNADTKWLADFVAQHGLDPRDPQTRIIAAEEYAASIAEHMDTNPTLLRRVIDAVRSVLRKLGAVRKWSDADIQALLRKSRTGLREASPRLREQPNDKLRYAADNRTPKTDDDHPMAIANKIGATVEEQANYNPGFVRSRIDALKSFGQNNIDKLLGAMPRDKLPEFIAPGKMPSTVEYIKEVQKMDGRRNALMVETEKTAKRWLKYTRKEPKSARTLSELMHAATIAGVEPANTYRPLYENANTPEKQSIEATRRAQHARLRKFWNQLDGEGKALYIDVRESYAKDRQMIMDAMEQRIQAADADGKTKASLIAELRQQFEAGRVAGPYFPLARFGKHWASAKDAEGNVVSFTRFEKPTERDAWRAEMERQGYKTDGGQKLSDDIAMAKALDPTFVAKITDMLNQIDPEMADDVWQHYLRTLPELSMRKHFIHRQGRLGFTGDAVRAFGYQKFHSAHQISRLEHMSKLERHLESMGVEARTLEEAKDREAKWAVPILEEFKQRHEWARNPKVSPFARMLTSLGYAYYMAASPATALVNLTQTAAVGLPVLAGEFNPLGATSELMRATAQWTGSRGDFGNRLRGDERLAFDEAQARGIYEKTQAHDLAGIGEEGQDFGSVRNQAMQVASFLFHHIERFNREATHMAAYRLARRRGDAHEAANELAMKLTEDAHFNYTNANRPRFMQNDAARVLLLFRNYAVNMTYRLARDFRNGVIRAGKTKAEQHGAFTRFAGMLGATMLQAGVTGLPMWWAAKKVMNLIFGDEDTPFEAEAALYAHLSHQYGETTATAIMHGAVDAFTPATLSTRVGLNNLWLQDPPANLEGRDEGLWYLQQLAGPVGGLVVKAAQAAALPEQGHADRALEMVVPKAMGDVIKATRYAREGVLDKQGNVIIPPEQISNADAFTQAIGFTPSKVSKSFEQNRNIKAAVTKVENRRQLLMNRLFLAAHADDTQGIAEALEEITSFNQKNPSVAIKANNIVSSAKARNRYSQQAIDGLRVEPGLRYLQEDLRIKDKESE